ncbi:MAG: hypothetical protein AMXMBFR13_27620 [Phycisphaerae bacterium]|jgi:ADP-ribose pyrophosphatase
MDSGRRILWEGSHLRAVAEGHWEFVTRKNTSGVVGIVAITDDRRLVLVEQYRPPLGRLTLELPAGLAGDKAGAENESLIAAGRRELLEETGYEAGEMTVLADGVSSAGLADEVVMLLLARGLRKVGPGGGDSSESITVHEVCLAHIHDWLRGRSSDGAAIDLKVYAGLELYRAAADGTHLK